MKKRAFTLIEMSIVLTIIAIVLGALIPLIKSIYTKNIITSTKSDLEAIKNNLIAYSATRGYLPKVDSDKDGIGDSLVTTEAGYVPYIDINSKKFDGYGVIYRYDVVNSLTSTTDNNICTTLYSITTDNSELPKVVDESGVNKYSVVAVLFSTGKNKVLTGENSDSDREYEMAINKYNISSRDDILVELSAFELISSICDTTKAVESLRGTQAIKVYGKASGDDNVAFKYKSSATLETSGCINLSDNDFILISPTDTVVFYPDNNCSSDYTNYLEVTYSGLSEYDDDNDSMVEVDGNSDSTKPTINDY